MKSAVKEVKDWRVPLLGYLRAELFSNGHHLYRSYPCIMHCGPT